MRKLFILLLATAISIWTYVLWQFVYLYFKKTEVVTEKIVMVKNDLLLFRSKFLVDSTLRDPFQSLLYTQTPIPLKSKSPVVKTPLKIIEPPKAILTGILWGTDPVAILKQDSQTELVKVGAQVWDFKILLIERHQVTVIKEGRKFILGYP